MNTSLLEQLLIVSMIMSVVTMSFIQKTKKIFKTSKFLELYSAVVNLLFAIIFCLTFTKINILNSLWVGLFSFLGADTIYKSLEGKLSSFSEMLDKNEEIIEIERDDIK